jgi:hypothetical protein
VAKIFYSCLCLVILLGALPNYSTKPLEEDIILNNGCLIYAIQYQYALKAQKILGDSEVWAKIIIYRVKDRAGHAIVLYIYNNNTYVYDPAVTSYKLAEYPIYDPYKIAKLLNPLSEIVWAEYSETVLLYNPS